MCRTRVLAQIEPRWGRFSAHSTLVECLTAVRTVLCVQYRFTGETWEENTIRQQRDQRAQMGENRKLQLQLCDVEREFPEHYMEYSDVFNARINFKQAQKVPENKTVAIMSR